jgi:hypothetical protein
LFHRLLLSFHFLSLSFQIKSDYARPPPPFLHSQTAIAFGYLARHQKVSKAGLKVGRGVRHVARTMSARAKTMSSWWPMTIKRRGRRSILIIMTRRRRRRRCRPRRGRLQVCYSIVFI